MPKVEREEFFNIGVIVYCKQTKYLKLKIDYSLPKFQLFNCEIDLDVLLQNLHSFESICLGNIDAGSIAMMDNPSRFRWLTATKSTIIQTSKVHSGFTNHLDEALEKLFFDLVL